ncbi:NAD-dependent deacylase [Dokdonia sinensis]|uniref:NAD-dependent protein deacylase n=1 Tax=Dokdonia sinensis TaxID=2479847 RepID=A0A3M0G7B9_9FLAO|nr:NAD-dependent deacylase [Dokdonia sinensis]RMB60940.1 NAD-dependent deacylase [Dokdonia sinensis]
MSKKKIVVLTGAGISAESGLKTFRDSNGLWEGHDVMEVATPQGWEANMKLVLQFYNARRKQLLEVKPNEAHKALVDLEEKYHVAIITQNVDDLHERAGSTNIIHLHGELLKVRSTLDDKLILDWKDDLNEGDMCKFNHQLRPHIVWFGEAVPLLDNAAVLVSEADIIIIIGTSMQVYPAAGLIDYSQRDAQVYFIDPHPSIKAQKNLEVIAAKATTGVSQLVERLLKES